MKQEIQAIRSYARNLRYLAEDWAPVGVPLPDILNKDPAFLYATEETNENNESQLDLTMDIALINEEKDFHHQLSFEEKKKIIFFSAMFFIQGITLGYVSGT